MSEPKRVGRMSKRDREELFLMLFFAGGFPQQAVIVGPRREVVIDGEVASIPKFSLLEYERALENDDYNKFKTGMQKQLNDNAEGLLLSSFYNAQRDMISISTDERNYNAIATHYREIMKLVTPIQERLAMHRIDSEKLGNLELAVFGAESPGWSRNE